MADCSEGALQVNVTFPNHPEMAELIKKHLIQVCPDQFSHLLYDQNFLDHGMHEMVDY